jgi:hypothetical protein
MAEIKIETSNTKAGAEGAATRIEGVDSMDSSANTLFCASKSVVHGKYQFKKNGNVFLLLKLTDVVSQLNQLNPKYIILCVHCMNHGYA